MVTSTKRYPDGAQYVNDKTVTVAGDFTCISEGYQFDLGGVVLDNYDIPGHTPGCMMLLDKAHTTFFIRPISWAVTAAALQIR